MIINNIFLSIYIDEFDKKVILEKINNNNE